MKFEYPVLVLLAGRRMTGWDLKRWSEVEGRFLGLDRHPSQIYRELNRLQVEGWIDHEVDPRDGVPDAKLYRVTDAGLERLLRWVRSEYQPPLRLNEPEFYLRLRAASMLDLGAARDLVQVELKARRLQVLENRGRTRPDDHTLRGDGRPEVDADLLGRVADEVNRYGERLIDGWIQWLEELSEVLAERIALRDAAASRESRA